MKPIQGDVIDAEVVAGNTAVQAYQPPANPFDAEPQRFAMQVQQRGQNYQHLVSWLCDNMVMDEDMVRVHFVSRHKCRHGGPSGGCTPSMEPGHWSDPDLSKKGAEKICGLLGLATRFLGMEDFRKAALSGVDIKQVIIDCELYGQSGQALSQGTGSCSLQEMDNDLNGAMKRAAKRAHVDAVKRVAGLSGIATELKRRLPPPVHPGKAAAQATRDIRTPTQGVNPKYATGAVITHVPFGKNKDQPWREVPTAALEWYVQNWADKPDLVRAAAGELSKRSNQPRSDSTRNQQSPGNPPEPEVFDDDVPY